MTDEKIKLVIGSLLHDVGKVIYRKGDDRRNHSVAGYDFLKEEAQIRDKDILDCVKYHHMALLRSADLDDNSLAYIVYIADNIAAFADRRKKEDAQEGGFELSIPLQSIFNVLNGNHEQFYYQPGDMEFENGINFPSAEKKSFSEPFYSKIRQQLLDNLQGQDWNNEYLNSLLSVMEANLSYIPSSTSKAELTDISLYDHVKLTAAIACCIYDYLNEKQVGYKETLFHKEKEFYEEHAFVMCSLDVSGIQNFIYTITSRNALRTLRARSFYLEIMMEHMVDLLLDKLELSRANLIYSGGGHCYLLLPNTENTVKTLLKFKQEMNTWFLKYFQTELFIAFGYVACSANALRNVPEGSYANLFHKMSEMLSRNKMQRYSAEELISLNTRKISDYSRECKVCRNIGQTDEEGVCAFCRKMETLSKNVLYSPFFSVVSKEEKDGLPLPGEYLLLADEEKFLRKRMEDDPYYVRTYSKNKPYIGKHIATKLWVGDYTTGDTFEKLAEEATGIDRIGVLRADVDNLGQTFVAGFSEKVNGLSRTATLSRQLSVFFKYFIRWILENGEFHIDGTKEKRKRNATIVYSGGDDVFIVGAWNEIIEIAVDLRRNFERYTQGRLSISAGIGIYDHAYPIAAIAQETGDMESEAKTYPGKNAVFLMDDGEKHTLGNTGQRISDGVYSWKELEENVIGEKYRALQEFFENSEDRGMAFMYRMLELIRGREDKINFARFVYLLSRMEPADEGELKENYMKFSRKMYNWIQSDRDCRELKTAMNLYAYMHREREEKRNED